MSKAQTKKDLDKDAAEILALINDGRERDGSTLLAPLDAEELLDKTLAFMQSNIHINGTSSPMPRYGLHSHLLMQTKVLVYGHPALKRISKTAFTDGMHIFVCSDFLDKLVQNVNDDPNTWGLEWLLMHELEHKMRRHVHRLNEYPNPIPNQATDLSINVRLLHAFPDMKPCLGLKETGLGFRPGDPERYLNKSEEAIAEELYNAMTREKKRKQESDSQDGNSQNQNQKQQPGQKPQPGGQGGKGQSKGQGQQPGQDGQPDPNGQQDENSDPLKQQQQQGGQGGKGSPQKGGKGQQDASSGGGSDQSDEHDGDGQGQSEPGEDFGGDDDNHLIKPQDLAKILKENGLEAALERLELPQDVNDDEAYEALEKENQARIETAIYDADRQRIRCEQEGGKYPGAHCLDSALDMIKANQKAKISWRLKAQDKALGSSKISRASYEDPHDLYSVDFMQETLGMAPVLPVLLTHKSDTAVVVILDSSGSMHDERLKSGVTEVANLRRDASGMGESASRLFFITADTIVRGEPIDIDDQTLDEMLQKGFPIHGRGGTSIETVINQVLESKVVKDYKVKTVIYITDMEDSAPEKPSILDRDGYENVDTLFLCVPPAPLGTFEAFEKGVAKWGAEAARIDDGVVIDMTMEKGSAERIQGANAKRPSKLKA